jgi:hypothetical protein
VLGCALRFESEARCKVARFFNVPKQHDNSLCDYSRDSMNALNAFALTSASTFFVENTFTSLNLFNLSTSSSEISLIIPIFVPKHEEEKLILFYEFLQNRLSFRE